MKVGESRPGKQAQPSGRRRRVPQRTCIACRQTGDKRSLVRVARTPEGVRVDPTGKAPGRGAYVHRRMSCWQRALAGEALRQALKLEAGLTEPEREALQQFAATMPAEEAA